MPERSGWLGRMGTGLLLVLLTLLLAEVLVRYGKPMPRVPVVRLQGGVMSWSETDEGVPLWRAGPQDVRYRNEDCPGPDTFDIALVGDSIFYSIDDGAEAEVVSLLMERALSGRTPEVCVLNVSEPGYFPYQQTAELQALHARHGIDLAVIGVWKPARTLTRLGDTLYDLARARRDEAGTPVLPYLPMPTTLRRSLFLHSRFFEYATLALSPLPEGGEVVAEGFPELAAWTTRQGLDAIFVELPPLDGPLDAYAATRRAVEAAGPGADSPLRYRQDLAEAVRSEGGDYRVLAYELAADDVQAIRLDPCCHYNRLGHQRLAEVLTAWVLPHLPSATDPGTPAAEPAEALGGTP